MSSYVPTYAYVGSADGTRIYAEAVGDPAKPPIMFIHGGSLSSIIFDSIFNDAKWTDELYLIRYDVRGHGRSDMPTDDASWVSSRLAEDFDAVIQRFNVVRPYVVGWSIGATHFVDILSLHPPSYLAGIININGPPFFGPSFPRFITPAIGEVISHLRQPSDVDAYQKWALRFIDLCADDMPYHLRQICLGDVMVRRGPPQDGSGLLAAIRDFGLPMLLVLGENDKITNVEELAKYVQEWKSCTMVKLSGADHTPWIKHPDLFRETVLNWIH
ncbi:Alpha/Beta hydrolase protein [Amanita rubescens]|nr:Alpha/Beta hydrolase protein [Amanita rubescens]